MTLTQDIFKYSNYCSYTLGRIIEKVTGKVALDYANECIFKKLDIQMPRWSTCNLGYTICAKNLFLNVDELDRVAQLVKNMGIFGTNIIMYKSNFEKFKKEFYVNSKELEYKNSFWNIDIDDGYFMKGIYANMLINIPKQNTTITITANERNNGKRDMLVDYITEIFN